MPSRGGYELNRLKEWVPVGSGIRPFDKLTSVTSASTENLSGTYADGPDSSNPGVGACLTGSGKLPPIGGVSLGRGGGYLLKDQTDPAQNGVYIVVDPGAPGGEWKLVRDFDFDEPSEFPTQIEIEDGLNAGRTFVSDSTPSDIGTDPITWGDAGNSFASADETEIQFFIGDRNPSLSVPFSFIRQDATAPAGIFPVTPGVVTVVSDSALDSLAGGGASMVLVYGLDASGDYLAETVVMDGTTPVLTSGTFSFVNGLHSFETGGLNSNIGNITATLDGVVNQIMPTNTGCGSSQFKVPNGGTLIVGDLDLAGDTSNTLMNLCVQRDDGTLKCVIATLDFVVSDNNGGGMGKQAKGHRLQEGEILYFRGSPVGGPAPCYAGVRLGYVGPQAIPLFSELAPIGL